MRLSPDNHMALMSFLISLYFLFMHAYMSISVYLFLPYICIYAYISDTYIQTYLCMLFNTFSTHLSVIQLSIHSSVVGGRLFIFQLLRLPK